MKKIKARYILVTFALLLVLLGSVFLFVRQNPVVIVLTSEGFVPNTVQIKKDTTVIFKTSDGVSFWPASNVHPSHTGYPDFDPKKPVDQDDTWSFIFTEAGTYSFHDHIRPLFTGTIVVTGLSNSSIGKDECSEDSPQCLEKKVRKLAKNDGAVAALDYLKVKYETDTAISDSCHGYTHSIGQESYSAYAENGIVEVTSFADYCGFGFYHGFMEAMLHTTGDVTGAKEFCGRVRTTLSESSPSAISACLHGIGHGVIDGSDTTTWGSPQKMIERGLVFCEDIGENYYDRKICGTGIFNSLALMYVDKKYNLVVNTDNPYQICTDQKKDYFNEACHEDMNTLVWNISKRDFATAVLYLQNIETDPYVQTALRSLALIPGSAAKKDSFSSDANVCQSLSPNLQSSCIEGYAVGITESGSIATRYNLAFDFCDADVLSATNKYNCYQRVTDFVQRIASEEVHLKSCEVAKYRYAAVCDV